VETVKKLVGNVDIEYKEARAGDYEGKIVSTEKAKKRSLTGNQRLIWRKGLPNIFSGIGADCSQKINYEAILAFY